MLLVPCSAEVIQKVINTVGYDLKEEAQLWGVWDRKGVDCDLLTFLMNFMLE